MKKNKKTAIKYTPEELAARKKFLEDSYAKEQGYLRIHREHMLGERTYFPGYHPPIVEDYLRDSMTDFDTPEAILEAEQELEELIRKGLV